MSRSIRVFKFLLTLVLCFLLQAGVRAQQVRVAGAFLKDSIRIGEDIPYYLTARYPSDKTVLFPDSTFSFIPFEFSSKKYFATRSTNGESYDSVVYHLTTFEIDSIQFLRLPVFVAAVRDCTTYTTNWDTIYLDRLVRTPLPDTLQPQNLPLKVNTAYEQVFYRFNYFVLLIIVGSLLIIAVIVWVLFGKKIKRHFRIKKLERNHHKFIDAFTNNIEQLKSLFSTKQTETTLFLWKNYLEQLERKPFTKLTTHETIQAEQDKPLGESLGKIDKVIYGHDTSAVEPLETLRKIAEQRFTKKLEEVKHG